MTAGRVVRGVVSFFILASLPLVAVKRPDVLASQNGFVTNCPPRPGNPDGVCGALVPEGTATLTGTDMSGNPVTVTIQLYNWGSYKCSKHACDAKPTITNTVIDVQLAGTDTTGIESLVVKGKLSSPAYVSCGGAAGIGCVQSPAPDGSDIQEPTPITGADTGVNANTRWDFGGLPPLSPPPPAIPFDQLLCFGDGTEDGICESSTLGEAVVAVANTVAKNHLGTDSGDYLVTLTDGTQLGTLAIPKSPTKQVATTNNTQAAATVITKTHYKDYTDSSQAYPQINADGSEQYPEGFVPIPLTNPPSCNPENVVTGELDNRTFRTAWYTYTPPSDGSVTINTAGSRYDTLIYVFTGSASQPTVVSCVDDPPTGDLLQAATTFNVTEGTEYQIVVGETPTFQTTAPGSLTGYPLSVDGTLYFSFVFTASN